MKKAFDSVRVLMSDEMVAKHQERQACEAEHVPQKKRKAVLKGTVSFSKKVWKEMSVGADAFI